MSTKRRLASRPDFSNRLSALPTQPGVYIMKNAGGDVLYVGKAQALRNRVRSYFQSQIRHDPKTRELVGQITDFEVIRTDTATEALMIVPGPGGGTFTNEHTYADDGDYTITLSLTDGTSTPLEDWDSAVSP